MKLNIVIFIVSLVIGSVWSYPAASHPDNDAEVIVVPLENRDEFHHEVPVVPSIPLIPSIPSVPEIPTYPSYPSYPSYPTFNNFDGVIDTGFGIARPSIVSYLPINPFGWNLNIFDRFGDIWQQFRDRATSSWSHVPSFRPSFISFWPEEAQRNGNTTSTVKVVDGHKVIINDTVYVKKTEFGDEVYKVRVVDVKPLDDPSVSDGDAAPKTDQNDATTLKKQGDNDDRIGGESERDSSTEVDSSIKKGSEVVATVSKDTESIESIESTESLDKNDNNNADIDNVNTGSPEELDESRRIVYDVVSFPSSFHFVRCDA